MEYVFFNIRRKVHGAAVQPVEMVRTSKSFYEDSHRLVRGKVFALKTGTGCIIPNTNVHRCNAVGQPVIGTRKTPIVNIMFNLTYGLDFGQLGVLNANCGNPQCINLEHYSWPFSPLEIKEGADVTEIPNVSKKVKISLEIKKLKMIWHNELDCGCILGLEDLMHHVTLAPKHLVQVKLTGWRIAAGIRGHESQIQRVMRTDGFRYLDEVGGRVSTRALAEKFKTSRRVASRTMKEWIHARTQDQNDSGFIIEAVDLQKRHFANLRTGKKEIHKILRPLRASGLTREEAAEQLGVPLGVVRELWPHCAKGGLRSVAIPDKKRQSPLPVVPQQSQIQNTLKHLPLHWVLLSGYDAPYALSDAGDLVRLPFVDAVGRQQQAVLIKPQYSLGTAVVRLLRNGKREQTRLTQLIAAAFLGCDLKRFQVRHKDGDVRNLSADNLEWSSYASIAIKGSKTAQENAVLRRNAYLYSVTSTRKTSSTTLLSHS